MKRCSIPDSVKIFLFSKTTRLALGLTQHPIPYYRVSLSDSKMVAAWRLNIHLHLLPSVRISGAIILHLRGVDRDDFSSSFTNNNFFTLNKYNFFFVFDVTISTLLTACIEFFSYYKLMSHDFDLLLYILYCLYLPALKQSSEFSDHCCK